MRGLLKFFAVLTWDWFTCRRIREANAQRPTVFDAHSLDAHTVAGLVADEPTPMHDRLVCEQMERAEGWA